MTSYKRRPPIASFLVATSLLLPAPAFAQELPSHYESEPNNTPAKANAIAGATTVLGTMNDQDQDGFMWTVSDEAAQKRWVFELQGIPGRLTIADVMRVEFTENGVDVAGQERLMKIGTRDGLTPAVTEELVFEPGEYLIGIAYAGGSAGTQPASSGMFRPPAAGLTFGDGGSPEVAEGGAAPEDPEPGAYRLIIRESSKLYLQPQPPEVTRDEAQEVRPGSSFHAFETRESAWYTIGFEAEDTNQRWDIRVQVPLGRSVDATLLDAAGQQLDRKRNGPRGHLEFPDIVPGDEPYVLQLEPLDPGFVTAVESVRVGQRVEGEEAEPNGSWELANRVDFSQPLQAKSSEANDADYFKFTVDEAAADMLQVLRIESEPNEEHIRFCLHDAGETVLQCRDEATPIHLPDLLLTPGEYGLSITRSRAEFQYSVTLSGQGPVEAGMETEPNDAVGIATAVPANHRIKGRGTGNRENDYYRFLVAEEPQLWRFQVIGDGIIEVEYLDAAGHAQARLRPAPGQRRLRLDDLYLLPGKHHIRIVAEDGAQYALIARALGPPDPNGEREPNNDTSRMQRLSIGQTRTGLLTDTNDTDYYRFFLANRDHVRLTVEPPPDGIVAPHVYWYDSSMAQGIPSEPGQVMTFTGVLPPGDYYLNLSANQPSDAEYRLSLERLPRWSCVSDCEPNGMSTYHGASPLPPTLVLEGVAGEWRDYDAYQLPVFDAPNPLVIRPAEPVGRILLGVNQSDSETLQFDSESGTYSATVPEGRPYQLIVEARNEPYRLELEFQNGPRALADPSLSAEMAFALENDTVAAFRQYGQVVNGELTVVNAGAEPLTAQLEAVTSDYRWQVSLDGQAVALDPGDSTTVPVEVRVPPDAWAEWPVRISARAFDEAGRQSETWTEIAVDREALPVKPAWNWAIPDELRGGFNAAWIPFGSELVGEVHHGSDNEFLRDGFVIEGLRVQCCAETYGWKDGRPEIRLKLPGDEAVPVAGMTLNNFGVPWPYQNLRRGTLMASMDGQSFEDVLSFETMPVLTEQYFALDEPVMARYVSLRLEETYEQNSGASGVTFGEWKVILAPGHDLSGGAGFDLASPKYGGHIVWDWPPSPYSPAAILDEDKTPNLARIDADALLEYVIAFQDNRAAQIQRVEWTNPEGVAPEYAFEKVTVAVSTESPIGPWKPAGEFDPGFEPGTATLQFDSPVWARFVKFTGLPQGDSEIRLRPNVIRIWERPTGPDYRSLLAEWGQLSTRGWFEEQAGIPPLPERVQSNNTSRDTAAPLAPEAPVSGQVELAKQSHWYRLTMPDDANTLSISMSGQPTVRTVLELEDSDGTTVPTNKQQTGSTPRQHVFEAFAEPGTELYFHVSEPPRNVIFTWDTSSSVNAHLPTIYNSMAAFVSQVVPGQESANFVPFGSGPLLDTWLGEPYMLQTILNDYPRRQSSSSGEHALQLSAQTLAPIAGTKSIVIVTDGAVVHHGPMWKEMREVQPRIFAVGVAGEGGENLDLFQDWVSVNGGHFTHLRYKGEMEVAFDRASTLMRRPADYTLEVQTEFREAPGPGRLSVLAAEAAEGAAVTGGAVELILDASGSMLQRMQGKRRIMIAKEVLTEAVREHIPAGTPVALRVFGHTEPGTCNTELLMPLAPLDPDAAAQTIANVQAKNLAKTPIADALAAVPSDLAGAQAAAVILVTDGEETCEGDPAAAIESLRDRGIDVAVNIVGFAIDDAALEAQFAEWAALGDGRYFSAQDETGLTEAVESALQIPYSVFDSGGTMVAEGLVGGEPLKLAQGVYRVAVKTGPQRIFEDVEVQGEDDVVLRLD